MIDLRPSRRSTLTFVIFLAGLLSPAAAADDAKPQSSAAAQEEGAGGIRTIVLDPGHGGEEVGAVGKSGVYEKDLSMDIARKLQERLTHHDFKVLLTRDGDRVLPLRQRTAMANAAKADLFISIHLNSSRRASAHGTEAYFMALTASDEESMTLARAENEPAPETAGAGAAPAGEGAGSDLEMVLWGMAQSEHLVKSSRLAEVIQDEMNTLLNVPSRGVKQAPFTVLMGATMPAVLVEVAFLSNESEEKLLATEEFRDKVAQALETAITRFKDETEKALVKPPSSPTPVTDTFPP